MPVLHKISEKASNEILNLSLDDRLVVVEEIWNSIAQDGNNIKLTEEQKRMLDNRLKEYYENPEAVSTWDEVKKHILQKK